MINLKKPIKTKNDLNVTILCSNGHKGFPIVGYIDGNNIPYSWTEEGVCSLRLSSFDLVNVPKIEDKYLNVYSSAGGLLHRSLEAAKEAIKVDTSTPCGTLKLIFQDDVLIGSEIVK